VKIVDLNGKRHEALTPNLNAKRRDKRIASTSKTKLVWLLSAFLLYYLICIHRTSTFMRISSNASTGAAKTMNHKPPKALRLVYHIGPPKMASTTIQIEVIQKYRESLLRDNFRIYDTKSASEFNKCLSLGVAQCQSHTHKHEWNDFVSFLETATKEQRNVLMSTENYWSSNRNVNLLVEVYHELFQKYNFEVTIVICYRRLFDYWPSMYYQRYRQSCSFAKQQRVDNVIAPLQTFLEQVNSTSNGLEHPTWTLFQTLNGVFANVELLNIHGSIGDRFLCDIVKSKYACLEYRTANADVTRTEKVQNQKRTLFYDRIAQAMILRFKEAGSKNSRVLSCKQLSNKVQHEQEVVRNQTVADLPKTCLPESSMHWLLQRSSHYEVLLFSNISFKQELIQDDFLQAFDSAIHSTLCDVDVEEVIENQQFLT